MLRLSGLMPKAMDIEPLLRDAKRQLHDEANYIREGNYLQRYGDLLADVPQYRLPRLHADLTTPSVLAMDYVRGVPIETLADSAQAERDRVMTLLQRKFGGLYLLAIRLKARVNLNALAKAAFASSKHSL